VRDRQGDLREIDVPAIVVRPVTGSIEICASSMSVIRSYPNMVLPSELATGRVRPAAMRSATPFSWIEDSARMALSNSIHWSRTECCWCAGHAADRSALPCDAARSNCSPAHLPELPRMSERPDR
jgi:hypothetical protein